MKSIRLLAVLATALFVLMSGSMAASADPPETYSGTTLFAYPNPCTGDVEISEVNFTNMVVASRGAFVQIIELELSTNTGGTGGGPQVVVRNQSGATGVVNIVLDYPDGSRVKALLVADGDLAQGDPLRFDNPVCVQA